MIAKVKFYLVHTGVNALYTAAGAGLLYGAAHAADLVGLGLDPALAALAGSFLGTIASRIQAKVSQPPTAAELGQ